MSENCENICEISNYIYNWLINYKNLKEESVTDYLLYEISNKIHNVRYKHISRHEEARYFGSDWQWWIVFDNHCAFAMNIQAKKIDLDKDNYHKLVYSNKYGLQIEKLLNYSKENNLFPCYAFYSSFSKQILNNTCFGEGVYISNAEEVYEFLFKNESLFDENGKRQKVYAEDIISGSKLPGSKSLFSFFCEKDSIINKFCDKCCNKKFNDTNNDKIKNNGLGWHNNIPKEILNLINKNNMSFQKDNQISNDVEVSNKKLVHTKNLLIFDLREYCENYQKSN
ncbi:MAG: hypothetical protein LBM96_03190 [Methanobrevibacter sp.]|jgi:hypothetical protein|nr:hypothetical protein [Candidatus Methanoflexus mossambicus]